MSTVALPDGSTLELEEGPTVEDVDLEIVTPSADEYLDALRHSAAHVFAQALQREFLQSDGVTIDVGLTLRSTN